MSAEAGNQARNRDGARGASRGGSREPSNRHDRMTNRTTGDYRIPGAATLIPFNAIFN